MRRGYRKSCPLSRATRLAWRDTLLSNADRQECLTSHKRKSASSTGQIQQYLSDRKREQDIGHIAKILEAISAKLEQRKLAPLPPAPPRRRVFGQRAVPQHQIALGRRRHLSVDSSDADEVYNTDTDRKYDDFLKDLQESAQQVPGDREATAAFRKDLETQLDQVTNRAQRRRQRRSASESQEDHRHAAERKLRDRSESDVTASIPTTPLYKTQITGANLFDNNLPKFNELSPFDRDEWKRKVAGQHNELRRRELEVRQYIRDRSKSSGAVKEKMNQKLMATNRRLSNLYEEQLLLLNFNDLYLTDDIFPIDTNTYFGFILQWWLDSVVSSKDPQKKVRDATGHFITMEELEQRLRHGEVLRILDRQVYRERLDIDKPVPIKKEHSALQQAPPSRGIGDKKPFSK